jgi:signal transduction histidine kinase
MVKVGVIDRGIGIPPQDQEAIFERFYRVSDIRAKQIKGSGVGLSITRGIIKRHGGEIWVESELGQGSRFYFTLPYEKTEEERR